MGVYVRVGTGVAVAVWLAVGRGVAVAVTVGVEVGPGVKVGVGVRVGVGVFVRVAVVIGVAVGLPSPTGVNVDQSGSAESAPLLDPSVPLRPLPERSLNVWPVPSSRLHSATVLAVTGSGLVGAVKVAV